MMTAVIPSRVTHEDHADPGFWGAEAFRNACPRQGIPLDTPIPAEAAELAARAWLASCRFSRAWCLAHRPELASGPCREDAPALWQRARDALRPAKTEAT